jgi:serine/threonine protein kinase
MGEVYRARDHSLGREIAVKVLREELASDPERLRRFEQEARAAATLSGVAEDFQHVAPGIQTSTTPIVSIQHESTKNHLRCLPGEFLRCRS